MASGLSQIVEIDSLVSDVVLSPKERGTGKGHILIATGLITPEILFNNGLLQNSIILYQMLESMGYTCTLLVEKAPENKTTLLLNTYSYLLPETYLKAPFPIQVYIEIGMSLDVGWKKYLKDCGTKIVKLYLGNILNIDIETTAITKGINFPHHKTGFLDEIWTSPHYAMNKDYASIINSTKRTAIAPYVWDSCFIEDMTHWRKSSEWTITDIVITEPNISFQKCCFFPLLLADQFARRCPEWTGSIILQNTERLMNNLYFKDTILPELTIQKKGRLVLKGRQSIKDIVKEHPSAAFICHQFNNDYNYMLLELMTCNFPVLHNSVGWSSFGYTWNPDRWEESLQQLATMLCSHSENLFAYKAQARQLAWKHSPWNPILRAEWNKLLQNETVL